MATFECFEDIEAWQRGRELTKKIYSVSQKGAFAKDYGLRTQIQRAAVSLISNIAEGFERDGSREFIQFLSYAKGSTGEIKTQLYVALDQKYIATEVFNKLAILTDKIGRMLGGLIRYLRESQLQG